MTGVGIFGTEFAKAQYHINQVLANFALLIIGAGAVAGVLAGGAAGDALLRRRLRSFAQVLAPLLFGTVAGHVFGGGRAGLHWTFAVMLVPLASSAALLCHARRTYPADVATAGGYRLDGSGRDPARR